MSLTDFRRFGGVGWGLEGGVRKRRTIKHASKISSRVKLRCWGGGVFFFEIDSKMGKKRRERGEKREEKKEARARKFHEGLDGGGYDAPIRRITISCHAMPCLCHPMLNLAQLLAADNAYLNDTRRKPLSGHSAGSRALPPLSLQDPPPALPHSITNPTLQGISSTHLHLTPPAPRPVTVEDSFSFSRLPPSKIRIERMSGPNFQAQLHVHAETACRLYLSWTRLFSPHATFRQ